MKHEGEIRHLKNRIVEMEKNIREVLILLMQAGIVYVAEEEGIKVYKIRKVKIDE